MDIKFMVYRRLEGARHCRWVDEVVAEAPWVIDEAFIKKYEIDYVAHDEDLYAGAGLDDVYSYVKTQGMSPQPIEMKWHLILPLRQIHPHPTHTWCIHLRAARTHSPRVPQPRFRREAHQDGSLRASCRRE